MDGNVKTLGRMLSATMLVCSMLCFLLAREASAAAVELSALVSYNRSEINADTVSRQNRYSGAIEFYFTAISSIKFSYTYARTRIKQPTNISFAPTLNVEIEDKVLSMNWVQGLLPSKFAIQPYLQIGGGRMWRSRSNEFPDFPLFNSEGSDRNETAVGGAGLKIKITKRINLKGEFTVLVPEFRFSQWKKNQYFSVGLSWIL